MNPQSLYWTKEVLHHLCGCENDCRGGLLIHHMEMFFFNSEGESCRHFIHQNLLKLTNFEEINNIINIKFENINISLRFNSINIQKEVHQILHPHYIWNMKQRLEKLEKQKKLERHLSSK